ncbi:MAG: CPBP family intramembrane metalloprotease [Roseburia sp.]|nr:CPBP family intramembrane metalloprotease [Roseburia sp.]
MMQVWSLIYPVGIYFVVTAVVLVLLDFILPETKNNHLLRQAITSVAVLPFLWSFYRQDAISRGEHLGKKEIALTKQEGGEVFLLFLAGGCFALAWNNVLGMVHISDYSASYEQIRETFYIGEFFMEFVAVCLLAPLAEELLYRGIVYKRAKFFFGVWPGILISAVLFGIVHMNLVQFIYAAVFGVLLGFFVEKTGKIHSAAAAHAAANLTSLLRGETEIFGFMTGSIPVMVLVTVVLFLAAGGLVFLAFGRKNRICPISDQTDQSVLRF